METRDLTTKLMAKTPKIVRNCEGWAKGPGFKTSSLVAFGIDSLGSGYSSEEGNQLIVHIDEVIHQSPIVQASAIAPLALLTGGSWDDPMTILADKRFGSYHRNVRLASKLSRPDRRRGRNSRSICWSNIFRKIKFVPASQHIS
jgi:hypothetical protein